MASALKGLAVWLAAFLFVVGGLLTGQTPVEFGLGARRRMGR